MVAPIVLVMEGDPGGGVGAADQPADVQKLFAILRQSPSGSFAAGALAALDIAVEDAVAVRYAAMSADEVRAVVRGLYRAAARIEAAALRAVKALDDTDLPGGGPSRRSGTQAAAFLRHAVGLDGAQSRRDATAARLLDADTGDLKATGAAFAAGRIRRGHADVAARVHAALGAAVRERVDAAGRRCVDAVDEVLAQHALTATVTELDRFGKRLVEELNPPGPDGAHARRFLHISGLPDGSVLGRFGCGPAQAALLRAAIAAGARPRPGKGIDADGVTHELPDERSLGQRQMDALVELVAAGLGRAGLQPPEVDGSGEDDPAARQPRAEKPAAEEPAGHKRSEERPPPREGREQVLRPPGALVGRYPDVEILVITTLEQLAQALGTNHPPPEPPDSRRGPSRPPGSLMSRTATPSTPARCAYLRARGACAESSSPGTVPSSIWAGRLGTHPGRNGER